MFTGIISAVGNIVDVKTQAADAAGITNEVHVDASDLGVHLTIHVKNFLRDDTKVGDSIAIEGACMTVVSMARGGSNDEADVFSVDVSRESLNCTVGLEKIGPVNLEHSMRLGDTLDGHLVSGHVDGLGRVSYFQQVGDSWELRIHVPAELAKYMAYKGSVTVNGVSLTVNEVVDMDHGCEISINLIPHTMQVTTLQHLKEGDSVNLEVDMIARYVERIMGLRGP